MRNRLGFDAAALQVFAHRARLQLGDVVLLVGAGGDAAGDRAPVVERLRDVVDAIGALADPQEELEVLDRVEGRVEATGGFGKRAAHDQQVADVHRAEQVDGREVGLEEGVGADPVRGQLVGVRVDDVELGIGGQGLGDAQQGVGGERVVVVEKADELPPAHRQRGVGRRRDAGVLPSGSELDPRVGVGVALQHRVQLRLGGAIVDDAQLPGGVVLGTHRLDRLAEVAQVGLVGRHRQGDRRVGRERLYFLQGGLAAGSRPVDVDGLTAAPGEIAEPPQKSEEAWR